MSVVKSNKFKPEFICAYSVFEAVELWCKTNNSLTWKFEALVTCNVYLAERKLPVLKVSITDDELVIWTNCEFKKSPLALTLPVTNTSAVFCILPTGATLTDECPLFKFWINVLFIASPPTLIVSLSVSIC